MTIEWHTKKINQQIYYKVIRRCVILNGDDGTPLSGYKAWKKFKDEVRTVVMPVERMNEFAHMFAHLNVDTNGKMAWGYTGWGEWYWFVTDSRDPRIFMQNTGPGFHEVLHMLYQIMIGTGHVTYQTCGNPPEAVCLKGKTGPAATAIVHDNWYGYKTKIKVWFLHSMWVPTQMPYIPIKKAKEMYKL